MRCVQLKARRKQLSRRCRPLWGFQPNPSGSWFPGKMKPKCIRVSRPAEAFLDQAQAQGAIGGHLLPTLLWPRPENQAANKAAARIMADRASVLRETAIQAGFTPDSLKLTESLLQTISRAGQSVDVLWPTNDTSRWLYRRFVARTTNEWIVLGLGLSCDQSVDYANHPVFLSEMPDPHIWLSGWQLLGGGHLKNRAAQYGASRAADGSAGADFALDGVPPMERSAIRHCRSRPELALPSGRHEHRGVGRGIC